jgi:hypothetical protein
MVPEWLRCDKPNPTCIIEANSIDESNSKQGEHKS